MNLEERADEIMRLAEKAGVQGNYFFLSTFERFRFQLGILKSLEKEIESGGMLVTKQYVRNRENVYINPALRAYNSTSDSVNKTLSQLRQMIEQFSLNADADDTDPLLRLIQGADEE